LKDRNFLTLSSSILSLTVALVLVILKVFAWEQTQSISILSSLVDSGLDMLISLVTFISVRASLIPADHDHKFGHGKYQAIAALGQCLLILASVLFVFYEAVMHYSTTQQVFQPELGISLMVISLFLTLSLVGYQRFVYLRTESIAVKADSMHYITDIFTNLLVIISVYFSSSLQLNLIDIIIGLILMVIVLYGVKEILSDALAILTDKELDETLKDEIRSIILSHPMCLGIHDLRTRDSGTKKFIQFHMELDANLSLDNVHQIDKEVTEKIERMIPSCEVIIHMDPR
jgi:ferrous-iron efflux pump FieF